MELDGAFKALRCLHSGEQAENQENKEAEDYQLCLLEVTSSRGAVRKAPERDALADEKALEELADSSSTEHREAAGLIKEMLQSENETNRRNGGRLVDMLGRPGTRANAIAIASSLVTVESVSKYFQLSDDKKLNEASAKILSMLKSEDREVRWAGSSLLSALVDPHAKIAAETVLGMLNGKDTQDGGAKLWQQLGYAPEALNYQLALLANPREQSNGKQLFGMVTSGDPAVATTGTSVVALLASKTEAERKDGEALLSMLNNPAEIDNAQQIACQLYGEDVHTALKLRGEKSPAYDSLIKLLKDEDHGGALASKFLQLHTSPIARDREDAARLTKMINGERCADAVDLLRSEKSQAFDHRTLLLDRLNDPKQRRGAQSLLAMEPPAGRRNRYSIDPSTEILGMLGADAGSKTRTTGEHLFNLRNDSEGNREVVAAVVSRLPERRQLKMLSELMSSQQYPEATQTLQSWLMEGGKAASAAENFLSVLTQKDGSGLAKTEMQQMMSIIADRNCSAEAIGMLRQFTTPRDVGAALTIRKIAPDEFKRLATSTAYNDEMALQRAVAMVAQQPPKVENPYVADTPKKNERPEKFEYAIGGPAETVLKMMADPAQKESARKLLEHTEGRKQERLAEFLSKPETKDTGMRLISMLSTEPAFAHSILNSGVDGTGAKRVIEKLADRSGKLDADVRGIMGGAAGEVLAVMIAANEPAMDKAADQVLAMLGDRSKAQAIRSILNVSMVNGVPAALELLNDPKTAQGITNLAMVANQQQAQQNFARESGQPEPRTTAAVTAMFMLGSPAEPLRGTARDLIRLLSDPQHRRAANAIIEGIAGNSEHIAKITSLLQDSRMKGSCSEFVKTLAKPGFSENFGNKGMQLLELMNSETPGAQRLFDMLGEPTKRDYANAIIDRFEFVSQAVAYTSLTEVDDKAIASERKISASLQGLFKSPNHLDQRALENVIGVRTAKPFGERLLAMFGDENAATNATALAIAKLNVSPQCELALALPESKSFPAAGKALLEMLQSKDQKQASAASHVYEGLFQGRAELILGDVVVSEMFNSLRPVLKGLNEPKSQESTKALLGLVDSDSQLRGVGMLLGGENPEKAVQGLLALSKKAGGYAQAQALLQNGILPRAMEEAIKMFNDPARAAESTMLMSRLLSDSNRDNIVAENLLVGLSSPKKPESAAAAQLSLMLRDPATEAIATAVLRNGRDPSTFMRIYNDKSLRPAADFLLEQTTEADPNFEDWSIANKLFRMLEQPAGPQRQEAEDLLQRLNDPRQRFHAYEYLRAKRDPNGFYDPDN